MMSQKLHRRMSKVAAPLDLPVGNEKHFLLLSNRGEKRKEKGDKEWEEMREGERKTIKGERIALLPTSVLPNV